MPNAPRTAPGHGRKCSHRADVFRCYPDSRTVIASAQKFAVGPIAALSVANRIDAQQPTAIRPLLRETRVSTLDTRREEFARPLAIDLAKTVPTA
jgi:hypothetical protein